jgi:hypothetical protein
MWRVARWPQEPAALLEEAKAGGFWSYAAGVAYHISVMFNVAGLCVDNYNTTLPIAKVLSLPVHCHAPSQSALAPLHCTGLTTASDS